MCSTFGERCPLLDAEAMLLVDDRDRKLGELDLALDERMGADGDLRDAVCDLSANLLRPDRPGQENAAHTELGAERLEREEVLLCECLGRRHQRTLPAAFD